jgi:hypothetical protein
MIRGLEQMVAEGTATSKAALDNLSPYDTKHINRIGNNILDFPYVWPPLPTEVAVFSPSQSVPPLLCGHANIRSKYLKKHIFVAQYLS